MRQKEACPEAPLPVVALIWNVLPRGTSELYEQEPPEEIKKNADEFTGRGTSARGTA